ncbi:YbaB/EbfC family nucleoid-associated protein [Mucilaginibacter sp. AW1-3]
MFDKLLEAQQKAGEVKKRLDAITVTGSAGGGVVVVTANGNKQIKSIKIDPIVLKEGDIEMLEDVILTAVNQAIEQAENISQSETAAMTKEMLGGMGGLGALFGK